MIEVDDQNCSSDEAEKGCGQAPVQGNCGVAQMITFTTRGRTFFDIQQESKFKLHKKRKFSDEYGATNVVIQILGVPVRTKVRRTELCGESSPAFLDLIFFQNTVLPLVHTLEEFHLTEVAARTAIRFQFVLAGGAVRIEVRFPIHG